MPNQGVPVIFKNKIAYGYAEKSVQAYDVSVSDYNALTEQQQLDGSIRFIQGVDAIPNGSNVWAKLGTTPLAEGLPRDCSQAVNQLKSNLTELTAIVTDTLLSTQGNVVIPYPSGFNANKCVITSVMYLQTTDRWDILPNNTYYNVTNASLRSDGIYVYNQNSSLYSKSVKVGLMKSI